MTQFRRKRWQDIVCKRKDSFESNSSRDPQRGGKWMWVITYQLHIAKQMRLDYGLNVSKSTSAVTQLQIGWKFWMYSKKKQSNRLWTECVTLYYVAAWCQKPSEWWEEFSKWKCFVLLFIPWTYFSLSAECGISESKFRSSCDLLSTDGSVKLRIHSNFKLHLCCYWGQRGQQETNNNNNNDYTHGSKKEAKSIQRPISIKSSGVNKLSRRKEKKSELAV